MVFARGVSTVVVVALLAASCSSDAEAAKSGSENPDRPVAGAELSSTISSSSGETTDDEASENDPVVCDESPTSIEFDGLPVGPDALIDASRLVFPCAARVVLVEEGAAEPAYAEAVQSAMAINAPLLAYVDGVLDENLRAELLRLAPERIRAYGTLQPGQRDGLPPISLLEGGTSKVARVQLEAHADDLIRLGDNSSVPTQAFAVTPSDATVGLMALATLRAAGADVVLADPLNDESRAALADLGQTATQVVLHSNIEAPTDQWRLDLALNGAELPGGGTEIFPDRRLVAFYGSPVTFRLGVLGEQDALETLERMAPIVESYATAEYPNVIPTFEIIATVADSKPGGDGDYSQELSPEKIRPWIDVATDANAFVIIDLQPGRANFLDQAKRYEEFLRLPNVGLALDPEWRIGPGTLPLQRVGSVSAEEVNAVSDWLVEIVREEALPQKPFVIHQFLRRMVPDRELINTPPELATVIHVDGQGGLGSKFNTYRNVTDQETDPAQDLWWGWKNFYDEDRPVARPDQVNEADPFPVVITFQ